MSVLTSTSVSRTYSRSHLNDLVSVGTMGSTRRVWRRGSTRTTIALAILDIDGTLIDTDYHHTIAWFRALYEHAIVLPMWRIHRHIGMGGDQMVAALTDERVEREQGDQIRDAEKQQYMKLIGKVQPMKGSRQLIEQLRGRGHRVVLASSAKQDEVDHYLDLLDARELADGWTTSADVEATKPAPDLVQSALRVDAQPDDAVMVGDTPWESAPPHRPTCRRSPCARVALGRRTAGGRGRGAVRVGRRARREPRRHTAPLKPVDHRRASRHLIRARWLRRSVPRPVISLAPVYECASLARRSSKSPPRRSIPQAARCRHRAGEYNPVSAAC